MAGQKTGAREAYKLSGHRHMNPPPPPQRYISSICLFVILIIPPFPTLFSTSTMIRFTTHVLHLSFLFPHSLLFCVPHAFHNHDSLPGSSSFGGSLNGRHLIVQLRVSVSGMLFARGVYRQSVSHQRGTYKFNWYWFDFDPFFLLSPVYSCLKEKANVANIQK